MTETDDSTQVSSGNTAIPSVLRDKHTKTKFSKISDIIINKLSEMQDLATLEVNLPVEIRMKKRLDTIRKMGKANSYKVNRQWKTIAPKLHLASLEGQIISSQEAIVIFSIYETDKDGNKVLHENKSMITLADGSQVERVLSAQYNVSHEVHEIIERGKPLQRKIIDMQN